MPPKSFIYSTVIVLCAAFVLRSCAPKTTKAPWKAHKNEQKRVGKMFGTSSKYKLLFHSLAWAQEIDPRSDGVLFCYEAIPDNKLTLRNGSGAVERQVYRINPDSLYRKRGWIKQAHQSSKIIGSRSSLVLTHSFSTIDGRKSKMYNIYDTSITRLAVDYDLYHNSRDQLDHLRDLLDKQLRRKDYTHIILMAHGWNNEQEKAIFHYNEWLTHIRNAASKSEGEDNFRPLYVAITWPSFIARRKDGGYVLVDFMMQANNADEMGMTHMNYLLWQVLEPLAEAHKKPLIVFGHSFGARMLSRACYAPEYTTNIKTTRTQKIDLFMGFQSAYRIGRHLENYDNTGDGCIYSNPGFNPWRHYVSTSSDKDNAMKAGKRLQIGVFMGHPLVSSRVQNDTGFIADKLGPNNLPLIPAGPLLDNKILLLDASHIISNHQDVNNAACGRMIWYYIKDLKRE